VTTVDVNADGTVDVVDVQALQSRIDAGTASVDRFDYTGDGEVDGADVEALYGAIEDTDADVQQSGSGGDESSVSPVVVAAAVVIGVVLYTQVIR